jgi:hypothetical protein
MGVFAWVVSRFGKMSYKSVVCKDSGLGQAVHAFPDFDLDGSMVDLVVKFIFVDECRWNIGQGNAHVFVLGHRCLKVKVFEVNDHEFCVWGRDDAIE